MLDTLANAFRIPELRRRILITVVLLAVCRIGVFIPVPGADIAALARFFENAGKSGGGAAAELREHVLRRRRCSTADSSRWA